MQARDVGATVTDAVPTGRQQETLHGVQRRELTPSQQAQLDRMVAEGKARIAAMQEQIAAREAEARRKRLGL